MRVTAGSTSHTRPSKNYFILLHQYFWIKVSIVGNPVIVHESCSAISIAVQRGSSRWTKHQPGRTITINPMHPGAKRQQGALTVISLMFVGL